MTTDPGDYNRLGAGYPTYWSQQFYIRDPQMWAVAQERLRHDQSLYLLGEFVMFALLWHIEDFQAGYIGRCGECYEVDDAVSSVYGQGSKRLCNSCYGTTFEGGYRALIVRPAVIEDTDEGENTDRRGITHADDVNIESTTDFRVRTGDYMFRQDGSRWQLRVPARTTLRTGFGHPYQSLAAIDYNNMRAQLEDPSSVAFLIGPDAPNLSSILTSGRFTPYDFTTYEDVRGPLIPGDVLED